MKNIDIKIPNIANKLAKAKFSRSRPFGIESHNFQLFAPLSMEKVTKFENKYRIVLPPEYRAFITQIGNGGAGPAYGLFPLDKALKCRISETPETKVPDDILEKPFAHTQAYNPDEDEELSELFERADRGEISEEELDLLLLYQTSGTLTLCHEGCGYLHRLIVNGPARGQMLLDGYVSGQGYFPLDVTFLEWYERWIDSTLAGHSGIWWLY